MGSMLAFGCGVTAGVSTIFVAVVVLSAIFVVVVLLSVMASGIGPFFMGAVVFFAVAVVVAGLALGSGLAAGLFLLFEAAITVSTSLRFCLLGLAFVVTTGVCAVLVSLLFAQAPGLRLGLLA